MLLLLLWLFSLEMSYSICIDNSDFWFCKELFSKTNLSIIKYTLFVLCSLGRLCSEEKKTEDVQIVNCGLYPLGNMKSCFEALCTYGQSDDQQYVYLQGWASHGRHYCLDSALSCAGCNPCPGLGR